MNEYKLGWAVFGLVYQIILFSLPVLVFFVSMRLTSRLRSVPIRALSSFLFSSSIFVFLFLFEVGWIFRDGWGPGNPDDMYDLPKTSLMQDFFQIAIPLFIFCAVIFGLGLGLYFISLSLQKKRQINE